MLDALASAYATDVYFDYNLLKKNDTRSVVS